MSEIGGMEVDRVCRLAVGRFDSATLAKVGRGRQNSV